MSFFQIWQKPLAVRIASFGFVEGQDFVMIEGLSLPNLGGAKSRAQTTKARVSA